MKAEFDKNASKKDCIIATFPRFCETGTVEDWDHSGRSSKITEEKIDEVHHVTENQQTNKGPDCWNCLLYFSNNSTQTYNCIETSQS